MRKQIYVAAIGLMLTMFIGLVYILPTQKTFAQTTVHAPVCFIEHNPTNLELVDCYGDPNFQQIWASFGGTEFAQHSFCYRITEGQAGIQQVDRDSPACGSWSQGKSESADNPSTPSPSTPSPSTPSPSTPSTGNTTHTNNAPAPSPATPAYTKRDGGFETVDQNCSADSVNGNGSKNCDLFKGLNIIANVLAAGVAVVVVVMVIIGGIQYSTSGGDPGKVAAAKSRIFNAVLALVAFFFLYAFLQWIVPGGIF